MTTRPSALRRSGSGGRGFVLLPLLAALAVVLAACSDGDGGDEAVSVGPLAVMVDEATGASDASAGAGTVDIGDRCVTFTNEQGTPLLLVWRSAEVEWDDEDRTITFTPTTGGATPVVIADGDTIVVGGEPFESDDPGLERDVRWRTEPADGCTPARFIVHSVTRP